MKAFIIHDIASSEIVHVFVGDDRAITPGQIRSLGARLRRVECELIVLPAEPISFMEAVIKRSWMKTRVHDAVAAIEAKRQ
jgi:hypothetical protein